MKITMTKAQRRRQRRWDSRKWRCDNADSVIGAIARNTESAFHDGGLRCQFGMRDNGRVLFTDSGSGWELNCSNPRSWRKHFTQGETLLAFAQRLYRYIMTGEKLHRLAFGLEAHRLTHPHHPWAPSYEVAQEIYRFSVVRARVAH